MIGAMPASSAMMVDPVAEALTQPFVWGAGGAKMTPEEVAVLRAQGEGMAAADFSPVGHWTQGLGRALTNLEGGMKVKKAREGREANDAVDAEIRAALLGGDVTPEMLGAALMDPSASDATRGYAGMMFKATQPKPREMTQIEKIMTARGIQEGSPEWNATLDAALLNETDPMGSIQGPNLSAYGRQSFLANLVQEGGGQSSGAGQTPPPPAAVEFLRQNPDTREAFELKYGAGSAAQILGGPTQPASGGF